MSYDLILMSERGKILSKNESEHIIKVFLIETNLDGLCEITDMAMEPSNYHLETLEECFTDGDFTQKEYEDFCIKHNLKPEIDKPSSCEAAALFLNTKWGQKLFSPTLPPYKHENEARDAYHKIIDFAKRHNLIVHDPQVGSDIDLNNPGDLPPMWK